MEKNYINLPNLKVFIILMILIIIHFFQLKNLEIYLIFPINPFKFIAKFEENAIFIREFINILSKKLEMFELINQQLKSLYNVERSFIPEKLFKTISIENDEITVDQINYFYKYLNSNKKVKEIFMKINCNKIDNNITLYNLIKFSYFNQK